ncbi:MAG: protein-S-isoprenylcysteine O-methyltransferase Ste14 [Bermanella sp.]|jgi:protein-S-isoprenylcysteine O-methyltransferase Ste14
MLKKLELLLPPLPFTIFLCGVIILCANLLPQLSLSITSAIEWGFAFWAMGLAFLTLAAFSFLKVNANTDPRKLENTKTLVTSGLYSVSRNPMYMGFLFFIVGTTCVYGHISGFVIAAFFIPYMNRFQIKSEEKYLSATFGEEYIKYCQSVRRWL